MDSPALPSPKECTSRYAAFAGLKPRRFTEFAASRLRNSLVPDLARLSAPKTGAEKKK